MVASAVGPQPGAALEHAPLAHLLAEGHVLVGRARARRVLVGGRSSTGTAWVLLPGSSVTLRAYDERRARRMDTRPEISRPTGRIPFAADGSPPDAAVGRPRPRRARRAAPRAARRRGPGRGRRRPGRDRRRRRRADRGHEVDRRRRAARSHDGPARLLQPLVNATGVLLHTNLGRAPIGDEALAAVTAIARGASNLELRLAHRRARLPPRARRRAARACGRRGGRTRRQQQRGRGAARARRARPRPRGGRVARRAGRDRRRLPRAGHHGGVALPARRGRHHQPHPACRLRARAHARDRARAEGPRVELPDGRLHRGDADRRARPRSVRR